MKSEDRELFNKAMLDTYDIFGKEANVRTIDLYFRLFEKYDINTILNALESVLKTSKYYPKPSEIIEQIEGGNPDDMADEAYTDFMRFYHDCDIFPVIFSDKITMRVLKDMPNWNWDIKNNTDNGQSLYFEFKRIYKRYYKLWKSGEWEPDVLMIGSGGEPVRWDVRNKQKALPAGKKELTK